MWDLINHFLFRQLLLTQFLSSASWTTISTPFYIIKVLVEKVVWLLSWLILGFFFCLILSGIWRIPCLLWSLEWFNEPREKDLIISFINFVLELLLLLEVVCCFYYLSKLYLPICFIIFNTFFQGSLHFDTLYI